MAQLLDEARAVAFAMQLREINKNIWVSDSVRDWNRTPRYGALDLANDALAELGLVIGSVRATYLEPAG